MANKLYWCVHIIVIILMHISKDTKKHNRQDCDQSQWVGRREVVKLNTHILYIKQIAPYCKCTRTDC